MSASMLRPQASSRRYQALSVVHSTGPTRKHIVRTLATEDALQLAGVVRIGRYFLHWELNVTRELDFPVWNSRCVRLQFTRKCIVTALGPMNFFAALVLCLPLAPSV